MEFRLLGPVEVIDGDAPLSIGGPKQRTVLALLALNANRVVTVDRLIDALWGSEPPETARNTLQTYVRHLRKAIGAGRIEHRSAGYLLRTETDEVDLLVFQALAEKARGLVSSDPSGAVQAFRDAIDLWRGPALDDLAAQPALGADIARLQEERMAVVEERLQAELASGRHRELVPELETLVREHGFRERFWGQLMVALYRSGRQGDALAAYQRARSVLLDELGVDPSLELQRIEQQILRQDADLDLGGEPLRGYRLTERIGEGAFGVVFRAQQPQVGREVAIKSIHRELANDPDFVRRFEREARLVARLEHPRVVPLYDYWRDPDGAYLVMRFFRGGNLRARIDRADPLGTDEVARTIDQIADALGAAHRQGIVHRDVKPENVLLDDEGNAYLSDFGIATDLAEPRLSHAAVSSPAYASPEQLRGEPVTGATDVYALGVVLFEMLTGRRPFPDAAPGPPAHREPGVPFPSVMGSRPDVPADVDAVIARATHVDPEHRFDDPGALVAAFREAISSVGAPAERPLIEVASPYKGLEAFEEADAPDYFGRERMVTRLIDRMAEDAPGSRLLAVVGPSGSGKSSLVRAGLLPALRRGALAGSASWFITDLVPGAHPFDELGAALMRVAIEPPPNLADRLSEDGGLVRAAASILPQDGETELVIVVDQFEELFTLTTSAQERTAFLAALATAATDPGSRLRIVVTLRADFYDRPLIDPRFGPLLAGRTEAIVPLAPDELERAIVGPADRVGVSLEPALLAEIVTDVADQPGALPLLEYALTELFDLRDDRTMRLAAYRGISGVTGALAARAEDLFGTLDASGEDACRQLFLRLVAVGEGAESTRRRVLRSEIDSLEVDRGPMERVIEAFGGHRLLSFDRDDASREPTVEIAHEALIRAWDRLRDWIEEGREDVRTHRRLVATAEEWHASGCEAGFLLSGARLERLSSWLSETRFALARREREFVEESLQRHEEEAAAERARVDEERAFERRSIRRLRGLVAALAAASLLAASLAVIAVDRGGAAERRRDEALIAALTGDALSALDSDPQLSLLLALHAVDRSASQGRRVPAATVEALHWAMQETRIEYPVSDGPTLVLEGPLGTRGVYDLPLARLVETARTHVDRTLVPSECERFFGTASCPALRATFPAALETEPLTPAEPADPARPLAGTEVTILPGDFAEIAGLGRLRRDLRAFVEDTGVEVRFVDFPELDTSITLAEAEGRSPDLAFANPGVVVELARHGSLVDLGASLDLDRLRSEQSPYLVSLGTIGADGGWPSRDGSLYGAFAKVNVKSLIWYPKPELRAAGYDIPTTWEELLALSNDLRSSGRTPWCLGLESGGATGWPGTDWIENLVLAEAGTGAYDRMTFHHMPFDSPVIRTAFRRLDDVVFAKGSIRGGPEGSITTNIFKAPDPLVDDPPGCWLHLGTLFTGGFLPRGSAGATTGVFPFPSVSGRSPALIGGGQMVAAFSDRPETRELVRFLVGPSFGEHLAASVPEFMSANRRFDIRRYPPFVRRQASVLVAALAADTFRFDASDLMPREIGEGRFWDAMVMYLRKGPESLDRLLADLDAAWPDDG